MEQQTNELPLMEGEQKYRMLIDSMEQGVALHKIILDDSGKPIDYIILEVNPAYERLTGLKRENLINKRVLDVLPNLESYWIDSYGEVALTGKSKHIENYAKDLCKYFEVTVYCPAPKYFAVIFSDVTEQRKEHEQLQEKIKELQSINELMMNRELKMIELKKEEEVLKAKIKE